MNDDWRLQITPHAPTRPEHLVERLQLAPAGAAEARELEHDLSTAFQDTVIVSRDGACLFLYAGTRVQAEAAETAVDRLAREHDWSLDIDLKHWHPEVLQWEDPSAGSEDTAGTQAAEHEQRIEDEREEADARGRPGFEVRADLKSRDEAVRFAERLRAEGLPVVQRWRYLLVGADDEDAAATLAERVREEAPNGASVQVEGTWQEAYDERPRSPFWFLGGLADT